MPINPSDLVDFCDALDKSTDLQTESTHRAIISRAYYASFHTAIQIIEKLTLPESLYPSRGSHQRQLNRLTNCTPSSSKDYLTIKSIGYTTSMVLNPHREFADYRLNETLPPEYKDEALARTKLILMKSQAILS